MQRPRRARTASRSSCAASAARWRPSRARALSPATRAGLLARMQSVARAEVRSGVGRAGLCDRGEHRAGDGLSPTSTATATSTSTATATATPTTTSTTTATPTSTSTATATSTPTSTATSTATSTVVIPPSRNRAPSPRLCIALFQSGDGTRLLLRGRANGALGESDQGDVCWFIRPASRGEEVE